MVRQNANELFFRYFSGIITLHLSFYLLKLTLFFNRITL